MKGETVYVFDHNRRVYETNPETGRRGLVIYREHFVPLIVFGETPRSWLASHDGTDKWEHMIHKLDKKQSPDRGRWYTKAQMEDAVWLEENRRKIANVVERLSDVSLLKQIATLLVDHLG